MKEENDYINQFKKSKKPFVPNGFFDNFYASVKDEIDAADVFKDFNIKKSALTNKIIELRPIVVPKKRKSKVIRMSFIAAITSVAAVLAILFYSNFKSSELEVAELTKVEDNYDNYLAYVDESTMVDFIIENEVDMQNEYDDEVYDYVEDDIEEIYLDLN